MQLSELACASSESGVSADLNSGEQGVGKASCLKHPTTWALSSHRQT
eukprot:CAMPEP_0206472140 /NCGR_PEP_ID=MMETSP0324_2-20121206/32006_1 /ASSEMBLY_ACC=CAM_ASM_000836 /TAXON_ID=2866 /ORGANISM="Crypthecodinium cohnii, Strain Seligo" /LENGTH=46 /DNA_ID= /DNA_START= /DNA_END= /DNA_ORIENTATION=